MKACKVDANHAEIVKALREAGAIVQSLAGVGGGVPDLLVGVNEKFALFEIKDGSKPPSARKLTPDQIKWHTEWAGYPLHIVDSIAVALAIVGEMQK